jgi:hypothetical protein
MKLTCCDVGSEDEGLLCDLLLMVITDISDRINGGKTRVDSESRFAIFLARILWKMRLAFREISVRVSRVSRVLQEGKNAIYCQACESRICETHKQAKS